MSGWDLPRRAEIGGRTYDLNTDYRDVLDIIRRLQDPGQPEFVRWYEALALFYEDFSAMPARDRAQAMDRLCWFIRCGQEEDGGHAPAPLLDWEQDRMAIVADVNKVAGCEIRALPYLHWWTFIAWFNGIGEGQLSTLLGVRDKLRRGKKLEKWEQEYYRANKPRVELKRRYSAEELAEQERLKKILGE